MKTHLGWQLGTLEAASLSACNAVHLLKLQPRAAAAELPFLHLLQKYIPIHHELRRATSYHE